MCCFHIVIHDLANIVSPSIVKLWTWTLLMNILQYSICWAKLPTTMWVIKFNHQTEFQSKVNVMVLAALPKMKFTIFATFLLVNIISHYIKEFKMRHCSNNSSYTFGRYGLKIRNFKIASKCKPICIFLSNYQPTQWRVGVETTL